ncbi:2TM domain-containing protein [Brachybacterium sp. GCM10030267]|uniref:2TM domain-containing protein n=1 Tax=unclassified Brachybacterium TaxID=2623841 RepID=UPI0036236263
MQTPYDRTDAPHDIPEDDEAGLRRQAARNIHARRGFAVQVAVYLMVNGILFWSWASYGYGFPWPLFVLVFWGIGLFWQAWELFGPGESEDRVRKEMDRLRGRR